MEALPAEVLANVFAFLSLSGIARCALVCIVWRRACRMALADILSFSPPSCRMCAVLQEARAHGRENAGENSGENNEENDGKDVGEAATCTECCVVGHYDPPCVQAVLDGGFWLSVSLLKKLSSSNFPLLSLTSLSLYGMFAMQPYSLEEIVVALPNVTRMDLRRSACVAVERSHCVRQAMRKSKLEVLAVDIRSASVQCVDLRALRNLRVLGTESIAV